ncbi:MAG: hypothetical protein HY903_02955 [Deltaproteobacteria bacterium]|nr:hypothetical protein [Deltaproteobacteria bacterium]
MRRTEPKTRRTCFDSRAAAAAIGACLLLAPIVAGAADEAIKVTAEATAPVPAGATDVRVVLTELLGVAAAGRGPLSFSEGRVVVDSTAIPAVPGLELHADGRFRHGWTEVSRARRDVDRLYLRYGNPGGRWSLGLGRQPLLPLLGAQVDGACAGLRLNDGLEGIVFGGLRPHPLTGGVDGRFRTVGVGYDARDKDKNLAGGFAVDWFGGALDRVYLTERAYARVSEAWVLHGQLIADFLSPQGILDDTHVTQSGKAEATDGFDLTQALLRARYQKAELGDVSFSAFYLHAIVPAKWWWDWIAAERIKRGFSSDEIDTVGTRRASLQSIANLRLSTTVVPYLTLRFDRRLADRRDGYEVHPGVKLFLAPGTHASVSYSARQYYKDAMNHRVSADFGADLAKTIGFEVEGTAMQSTPRQGDKAMLYEASALIYSGLGALHPALAELELIAQYQGFYEPIMSTHIVLARLAYRYRS